MINNDWKSCEDWRRKYQLYLASREWAEKKEAVKKRSMGLCEKCGAVSTAVHHLTYENKYNEPLEDLIDICDDCHNFIHGKSDIDPLQELQGCSVVLQAVLNNELRTLGILLTKEERNHFFRAYNRLKKHAEENLAQQALNQR